MVQHQCSWSFCNALVHLPSGLAFRLRLPTVAMMACTEALTDFAQAVRAGRVKQILLVLDGIGCHVSPQLQVPEGVHLHCLAPYSPGRQPAERLWPLTNEALADRHVQDLKALPSVQAHRCLSLQTMPEVIRAHINVHW